MAPKAPMPARGVPQRPPPRKQESEDDYSEDEDDDYTDDSRLGAEILDRNAVTKFPSAFHNRFFSPSFLRPNDPQDPIPATETRSSRSSSPHSCRAGPRSPSRSSSQEVRHPPATPLHHSLVSRLTPTFSPLLLSTLLLPPVLCSTGP